jgi:hypothetical protein
VTSIDDVYNCDTVLPDDPRHLLGKCKLTETTELHHRDGWFENNGSRDKRQRSSAAARRRLSAAYHLAPDDADLATRRIIVTVAIDLERPILRIGA